MKTGSRDLAASSETDPVLPFGERTKRKRQKSSRQTAHRVNITILSYITPEKKPHMRRKATKTAATVTGILRRPASPSSPSRSRCRPLSLINDEYSGGGHFS